MLSSSNMVQSSERDKIGSRLEIQLERQLNSTTDRLVSHLFPLRCLAAPIELSSPNSL